MSQTFQLNLNGLLSRLTELGYYLGTKSTFRIETIGQGVHGLDKQTAKSFIILNDGRMLIADGESLALVFDASNRLLVKDHITTKDGFEHIVAVIQEHWKP